jgi:hypothetical protein
VFPVSLNCPFLADPVVFSLNYVVFSFANSIVNYLKTLATHGISSLRHSETKNSIVKTKYSIVNYFKTLATHGISSLTHSETKNSIVHTKKLC